MRRFKATHFLRFLLATVVALASFGPLVTYAHSHSLSEVSHHDHDGRDDADEHDDDHGPELRNSVAHVHGSWLGFAITFAASEGSSVSDSTLDSSACPTLSGDLGKGLLGPLKERVPWPKLFIPPEPHRLSAVLASPALNPHFSGARISHALAGRSFVLRC